MKSIRSSCPVLRPAGLRGSMFMRGLVDRPSEARVPFCLVESLRPSEDDEAFVDLGPLPLMATNGCTFFSCPGEGPVERIKSARSRMESCSMRGSLASWRPTTFLLGEALCGAGTGPLLLDADLVGGLLVTVPEDTTLSALTRGSETLEELG
jgi:hypothetical protein